MQDVQVITEKVSEINVWLEIAKIAIPCITTIFTAILAGMWLSVRTEKIKLELQKSLTLFQTKFSLLHQRRADAIQEIFGLVAEMDVLIRDVAFPIQKEPFIESDGGTDGAKERLKVKLKQKLEVAGSKYNELSDAYFKKIILFDSDSQQKIEMLLSSIWQSLSALQNGNSRYDVWETVTTQIEPLRNNLESEFYNLLTPGANHTT